MAKAIVFTIAQSLLKNLSLRALDEIASAWGFKTHLEQLKNTIKTINNMLLDAEERQVESHTIHDWLDRLKMVVYDADDLFDEFATMASQREVMGGHNLRKEVLSFFSDSNYITFAFSISRRIKKVREDLDQIVKDSSYFAPVESILRPHEGERSVRELRDQTHSFVNVEEVVGRDDDKEAILDLMMASSAAQERELSVIPILGIGGQGKTTLAQLLYNDEQVENHFELKLWVCVSEVFDIKHVFNKILMSATNNESQNLEIDQLQGQLRKEIGGKKYLLVLDNVWNEEPEEWSKLSAILKVGGEGSKILVTTRSRKVADIMRTVPPYELKGLSEEKSWALFEKMAFEDGESQKKPRLVELGKEIVKKCEGVPLALRSLGTLLRGNDDCKWKAIAATSFAELPDKQNGIMAILKLSYHHLLSPLKNCFAYCALFPKDYKFEKETLVDLWMAEGFVVPAIETQSLKEVGDEYLMLLLQRCFFQDITRDKWGNILSFRMHGLMHDLALEIAATESKVAKFQEINFSDRIRHLSLGYHLTSSWEIPGGMLKAKHLRTFLLPMQFRDGSDFNWTVLKRLISNFRCLRVLDLRKLGVRILPKSIGKLIHLRYLDLSMNPIEELPHSVTRLHNLQTLILYHCRRLTALPINTRKLTNLQSLSVLGCRLLNMPPGLGELTSLHKLPCFIVNRSFSKLKYNPGTAQLKDLKTLNGLRGALKIKLVEDLENPASEALEANLSSKSGLTELSIKMRGMKYGSGISSNHDQAILEGLKPHQNLKKLDVSWYRGRKLPTWAIADSLCRTLPNLVEIRLLHCGNCQQVPSFSQLPFLRCLRLVGLKSVEFMERSLHGIESTPLPSTESFFPSLQELELRAMANLKGWWEETEVIDWNDEGKLVCYSSQRTLSFPLLAKLRIENCKKLASFPLSPNVKNLVLSNVNKDLTVLKKLSGCSAESSHVGSSASISKYSSKLTTLSVDEVEDLISLPEECLGQITSLEIQNCVLLNTGILEEVFKHLSILRCLKFTDCKSLTSISEGLEHLTVLESLVIHNCWELDLSQDPQLVNGMPWKALISLRLLEFHNIPKLLRLPSGIQHLTKLRSLKLSFNDNLETLPKWIDCFSSLEYMRLFGCPLLTCLPDEFCKLTSLNELEIVDCRELTMRCRGSTGSDWLKIKHIPLLTVKDSYFD